MEKAVEAVIGVIAPNSSDSAFIGNSGVATATGVSRNWSYGGVRGLILQNGSQEGKDFIANLESSGKWIYGFNSIQETQTLNGGLVWNTTGTNTRSIWSGSELTGFNPSGSFFGLPQGIFINNGLTNMQAVETIFHEFYHFTDRSEVATRLVTTNFMIAIGFNQSQIPGAINPGGTVNTGVVRASAPPYTTTMSRTGLPSDNINGFSGFIPGGSR